MIENHETAAEKGDRLIDSLDPAAVKAHAETLCRSFFETFGHLDAATQWSALFLAIAGSQLALKECIEENL